MSAPIDLSLSGRTALISGGGSGLGYQFSEALAYQGASLLLVGRTEETLGETCDSLPGDHRYVVGDLAGDGVFQQLAPLAEDVDILVNNAGGNIRATKWLEQSPDDWRATLELNVIAPNRLCQLVAPGMQRRQWGRIVNVASIYGFLGQDARNTQPGKDGAAYIAAKHAVIGLTRFLAGRLAADGITVNSISPGMFPFEPDDPAIKGRPWKMSPPSLVEHLGSMTPVQRVGGKRDLGSAIVFLASSDSSFVTGQNIAVDGGWSVW